MSIMFESDTVSSGFIFQPEGRAINWIVQRPSAVQERERDTTKPSSILSSPGDLTEKSPVVGSDGWEKAKMKGRRSATLKADASGLGNANGCTDGDREQKSNARAGGDSRSRPSEGHGFRLVPRLRAFTYLKNLNKPWVTN